MLLLLACSGTDDPVAGDDTGPIDTTGHFSEVTVTASEAIPTVQLVRFVSDLDGDPWVRFGPTGEEGWTVTATATDDGAWEATLVGLPPETDGEVVVGVGDVEGPTTAVTTGSGPDWFTMDGAFGTPEPAFLVLGVEVGGGATGAAILDTAGRPVWWSPAPEGLYGHLHTRARITPDGAHVAYIAFGFPLPGSKEDGQSELITVSLDGTEVERTNFGSAHHDFLYLPDGGMAWIDVDDRTFEGRTLRGETIVEEDTSGNRRTVWSVWDTFTPSTGEMGSPEGYWTIGNHQIGRAHV